MSAIIELTAPETRVAFTAPLPFQPSRFLQRKRLAVRVGGVFVGILLAPVIALLVAVVRLTSPGSAVYRQKRVGLHGEEFVIYKLRSMRQDAEKNSGPVWARKKDSRVTPVGRVLRFTHLDELPQIINVVRGEMDFVGPRPERPEIVDDLIPEIENYQLRHEAMPGITGLAQVNLEPDQEVDCVRKKVEADLLYIENATLWLDLRLVAATLLRMVGLRYEHGARMLGVTLAEVGTRSRGSAERRCNVAKRRRKSGALEDTRVNLAAMVDTVIEPSHTEAPHDPHPTPTRLPR